MAVKAGELIKVLMQMGMMVTINQSLDQDTAILVVSHDLLVVSRYVKSVACVNKRLHYHDEALITGEMIETMYSCATEEVCPVELVTHGRLPHRVLHEHHDHEGHDHD